MFKKLFKNLGGDPIKKIIESHQDQVSQINDLENHFENFSDQQLKEQTKVFKDRLAKGESLDELLPEAFAVVREASKRTIGLRHYDVQMIGGILLHEGTVAEMRTGEGKTLVATLPIYLNALTEKGVHLITVNDYLARRDARWMAPIFNMLDLSVGVLQMGSRTEGGKKAFLVNLEKESSQEDQHQLEMVDRQKAYLADITYGTNSEFGFDYLRDNMKMSLRQRSQRGHNFAIIDEVDNVLIDEARTPLIISGPAFDDAETYVQMAQVVKKLNPEDYEINEKDRTIALTEIGETRVEDLLGQPLRDPERPEDITPEQARLLGFLEQALRAQYLFKRNKEYIVQSGQVIIVDEFTGRMMPGRRWSDGLHQAVEAKEGVRVQSENITHATITIQNYFRMYEKLAGMTGTAMTEAEEFSKIYKLESIALPSNVEYIAFQENSPITEQKGVDRYNFEYTFYSLKEDPAHLPYLWKRKDYPDVVYRTEEAKFRAIVKEIIYYNVIGRPVLVGTTSVEKSEQLSQRLGASSIRQLMVTLLLRYKWLEINNRIEDGRTIMALSFLNESLDNLNNAELSNMARQLGISKSPNTQENIEFLTDILGLKPDHAGQLREIMQRGIAHSVLNARKHTEESQIIAQAGKIGAVTIATNMAGRGVDIKLGGEIPENIISNVNRVLRRTSKEDPFDLTLEQKLEQIQEFPEEEYGIYAEDINEFITSMKGMKEVKELGGLHVIGSERHEARRIDNQLRGRAARQGDPGSSRFFLSMEDELMRLFGGQQMDGMMQRLGMDEQLPMELNLVSRVIEGAQTRVEGANFDSRKHLLEYDDVLNSQRNTIYSQRDLIFKKKNLTENVLEMLETEVDIRVPAAVSDEESPWRLLAWLEQIQPSFAVGTGIFPSYTFKILLDDLNPPALKTEEDVINAVVELAKNSIQAEKEHTLFGAERSLEWYQERLEQQMQERFDTADAFFESLSYADETDNRSGRDILNELSDLLRIPIRFSNSEQSLFRDDPDKAEEMVHEQIESTITKQTVVRLVGALNRRLPEDLDINLGDLTDEDWDQISDIVLQQVEDIYEKRASRYFSENQTGSIIKQIKDTIQNDDLPLSDTKILQILGNITQESATAFDKKTHKRIRVKKSRFSYLYQAAHLIETESAEALVEKITRHLLEAEKATTQRWGLNIWRQIAHQTQVKDLPKQIQEQLAQSSNGSLPEEIKDQPVTALPQPQQAALIFSMGFAEVNETYRTLILRVISELWVEYLTKMEALRVSIGLEAYGQRDPLVVYKTQASQMFQELFDDMRASVVNRMFKSRPLATARTIERVSEQKPDEKAPQKDPEKSEPDQPKPASQPKSSKKRKRRRRR
jgi:preprotein translocase subunit SecA